MTTINLFPTTETLTVRDRGYQMVANDPLDGSSSLTFRVETVKYDASHSVLDHHHKTDIVVNAAETDEERAKIIPVRGLKGESLADTVPLRDFMTVGEVEYLHKALSTVFFSMGLQQLEAEK